VHRSQLLRVHDAAYIDSIEAASPYEGFHPLDPDTGMNPHSLDAAYHAAGGAVMAVDLVMRGEVASAFVACRPPGHHATRSQAMGFCLFNNVAVAAAHALEAHGWNGSPSSISTSITATHRGHLQNDRGAMLCSTFQHPFYPFCGADSASGHIVNVPLPAGTTGATYRAAFSAQIMPRLEAFRPQMLFFSAGFDAHREDDMAQFGLVEADYVWITEQTMGVAARHAEGRIVSVLEGGYDLSALGRSVAMHIKTLADL